MASPASRSCGYLAKTEDSSTNPHTIYLICYIAQCLVLVHASHTLVFLGTLVSTVPIVPFYKGVVTSVGRVSFFKDTHRIWISQKIKTSSSSFFGPIPGQGIEHFIFLSTLVLIELVFINLRPVRYPQLVLSNQL
jgi:hypothetical protein